MKPAIPSLAIAGGPCGGKTLALKFLKRKFEKLGLSPVTIEEEATEIVSSGFKRKLLSPMQFQRMILRYTIEKEDCWKEAAAAFQGSKGVLICDRGAPDIAAYLEPNEFAALLEEIESTPQDLLGRYDAVIFMRSVAADSPQKYTTKGNRARNAGIRKAAELDARTYEAWKTHPNIEVIDNSTGIARKLERAFEAACRRLRLF